MKNSAAKKQPELRPELIRQYVIVLAGSCLYGVGLTVFLQPSGIPMGGVPGISLVLDYLFGAPIGVMNFVLNIPLFALGYRLLGREFFYKTLFSIVTSSIFIDTCGPLLPVYTGDVLLAALFGGVIMGVGFGMVFRAGGTTGGTDVLSKYFYLKRSVPLGVTSIVCNAVVITGSAIVYKSLESAMYGIIVTYVSGVVIDKVVYGADKQKNAFIITGRPQEVSEAIMQALHRGVTALPAKGMYTGADRTMLVCAVRRNEVVRVKSLVAEADPAAFMMLYDVSEVLGEGFKVSRGK